MLRLFAALRLLLHGIHRLVQGPHIEANLQRALMYLREYGLLAAGRHKPHGLLVRPDRGDLPQPPRPVLPRPGFLSEPKKGQQPPPQTSGAKPSSTPAQEKPAKNPDSTSKVKHNVAPVTPPYNPPEREPKATPRKREKKQEPGTASTEKPPAVEKTADEMLDEELRKNTAQTSTDRSAEVDLEQLFIDAHQATGAELLQQSRMAESTETFDTSDPLTPFLAYVLFVLHYRNNPFADSWLIFKHSEMREIRDRKRAVLAHCRPWSTISHSEIDDVCLELLSLFEEAPKPESMNSRVFRTFAKALISAKLRVANHFKPGRKATKYQGATANCTSSKFSHSLDRSLQARRTLPGPTVRMCPDQLVFWPLGELFAKLPGLLA